MSLRDKIFASDDIPREVVPVPEWGCDIEVRGMTGADRTRLTEVATGPDGDMNLSIVYPDIVILCCYDPETGARIFHDEDRDAILSKSSKAIDRLVMVGMRLSGFSEEAVDEAGKGSTSTPSSGSSSDSPVTSAAPAGNSFTALPSALTAVTPEAFAPSLPTS